ncbi:TPA: hypothetical protein ACT5CJ_002473, partial [Flavobacterium psychrophilum]
SGCYVEITIIAQSFQASFGKIQFSRFRFSARNFCAKLFKFASPFRCRSSLLADSNIHVSVFQVSAFHTSVFSLSIVRF